MNAVKQSARRVGEIVTERELLELAAKAIGLQHTGYDCAPPNYGTASAGLNVSGLRDLWNPLRVFEDAFELQALLHTPVFWDTETSVIAGQRQCGDLGWRVEVGVDDLGGYRALCRAIVLDAAAIGRAMP